MQKGGEDRFLFTPGQKFWSKYFFQHDDLKLSTKSRVGSVPCVTLLFLEVFGPEKKEMVKWIEVKNINLIETAKI